jgi:hypothetical protein
VRTSKKLSIDLASAVSAVADQPGQQLTLAQLAAYNSIKLDGDDLGEFLPLGMRGAK